MIKMQYHINSPNENERLESLYSFSFLDDFQSQELDEIAELAANLCDVPMSCITFMDATKEWNVSQYGLFFEGLDRINSMSSYLIENRYDELVVQDARMDDRFEDYPLVNAPPFVIFFAGVPLITSEGYYLGALSIMDNEPRKLTPRELRHLKILANQIIRQLELKRTVHEMKVKEEQLEQNIVNLEEYTAFIAHDLRNPFRNIEIITEVLLQKHQNDLDKESIGFLNDIISEAEESREFIQDLLRYSKSIHSFNQDAELVDAEELLSQILTKLRPPENFSITLSPHLPQLFYPRVALRHVFRNLLENAIKYNQDEKPIIEIGSRDDEEWHIFSFTDNGNGIPKELHQIIFKLFSGDLESDGKFIKSIGVGLAIVSKLVALMNGTIEVDSTVGEGSTFIIKLPIIIQPI